MLNSVEHENSVITSGPGYGAESPMLLRSAPGFVISLSVNPAINGHHCKIKYG